MTRGCIYYTDFHVNSHIMQICLEQIKKSFDGEIVSVSLNRPVSLGRNIVLENCVRSYPSYIRQITIALGALTADYVFYLEHDVLYNKGHFDFVPPRDEVFYYNENVWRWWFGSDTAIQHDRMLPLSCMCVNREFAIEHYKERERHIERVGLDKFRSREPRWARRWGYEPGTKKKKRGGFSDDDFDTWRSELPVIDIRHKGTFSSPKITLDSFKHKPKSWRTIPIGEIPGWDLRGLFSEIR